MSLETPIDFKIKTSLPGGIIIEYINLMEICQGGPIVGFLKINSHIIEKFKFGGPFIIVDNFIYLPAFVSGFFTGYGFKLVRINITTLDIDIISKKMRLIFLDRIDGNSVFFYSDVNKKNLVEFPLRG